MQVTVCHLPHLIKLQAQAIYGVARLDKLPAATQKNMNPLFISEQDRKQAMRGGNRAYYLLRFQGWIQVFNGGSAKLFTTVEILLQLICVNLSPLNIILKHTDPDMGSFQ